MNGSIQEVDRPWREDEITTAVAYSENEANKKLDRYVKGKRGTKKTFEIPGPNGTKKILAVHYALRLN